MALFRKSKKDSVETEENIVGLNNIPSTRQRIIKFNNSPRIVGRMSVVGEKEAKGPVGKYFSKCEVDDKMGEKTFERAEIRMFDTAVRGAVRDAKLTLEDIDVMVSGDLLNQMTTSSYAARDLGIPHIGIYGACSTMTEGLMLSAILVDSSYYSNVLCAASSHFATAERQFRYPLEYGCQRPPYAQWTVTGAAASVVSKNTEETKSFPRIVMALPGLITDYGVNDLNNMGAAMAPAAMDTLYTLFTQSGYDEKDFDLIITGDLGKLGSDILRDLMRDRGIKLGQNYIDCGNIIYDVEQKCYQGGSGCACSATIFNSFVMDKLMSGEYKRVAYLATGALMSTQSCYQGETIPGISHAVIVESPFGGEE
ncbi:MAG: stage V sporulation protein AD [Clostridiales bacterium]|nr:stage V sporulation protein AD [Clostridiales bacterium]